jgi:energy-coupling factor transporter ATP-binding protein EcfA2
VHRSLSLTNFTAFEESQFTFVPGVNVLVGANATGKTHLMKLLYAMQKHAVGVASSHLEGPLSAVLAPTFNVERLGRLVRRHVGVQRASIVAEWNHDRRFFGLNTRSKVLDAGGRWRNTTTPVFIPVKDMLAHSRGFGTAYRQRELDYEQVYADILDLAMLPPLRGPIAPNRAALLSALQKQMRGTVTQKNERFYLNIREGRHQASLEMPLVAEGWRKLALLWLLVQNGSLAEGKVLFWDEPEANLNPPMFAVVADVLHTLAQVGVQVFVATHSYLILQELDLRRRTDVPFQYIVLSLAMGPARSARRRLPSTARSART